LLNAAMPMFQRQGPDPVLSVIPDAIVDANQGIIWDAHGRLILESVILPSALIANTATRLRPGRVLPTGPAKSHYDKAILIHSHWADNYFHWLLDFLPRLKLVEDFSDVPILLPSPTPRFIIQTLDRIGIAPERRVSPDSGPVQVAKLIFPGLLSHTGWPNAEILTWLRQKVLGGDPETGTRRLLISRRDASRRRILNEDLLFDVLRPLGFERICPGSLTFAQQAETLAEAKIVIGAHGAGLANMAFAPRSATLIELFPEKSVNGCYYTLANTLGQTYGLQVGKEHRFGGHFHIDPERIIEMLKSECRL
jgi:capsular polysaccharide biosynthesis protein